MKPGTTAFAEFATCLRFGDIPEVAVNAAKLHLLDTLGCGLAAFGLGLRGAEQQVIVETGGAPEALAIGLGDLVPAQFAAFVNGALCHALDFDDTHPDAATHISTVVGPAALAAGQAAGSDGRELLSAVIAGTETVARIAMAAPAAFHARGFHPTSVAGVFGAAAAGSRLWGLDHATTTNALGVAASMASGLFAFVEDGTPTKPVHAGLAAHNGLFAARLARAGIIGPLRVLEGRFGFYQAYVGAEPYTIDLEAQTGDLGRRWETPRLSYKPYPVCHAMHSVLGATWELLEAHKIGARDVEAVVARLPGPLADLVAVPIDAKRRPRNGYEAKFSVPYAIATMLVRGRRVAVPDFNDSSVGDPAIAAVSDRVGFEVREFSTYPHSLPGGVVIRLRDGTELAAEYLHQEGSEGRPWASSDVLAKFRSNASLALPDAGVTELEELVLGLDHLPSLDPITKVLQRAEACGLDDNGHGTRRGTPG